MFCVCMSVSVTVISFVCCICVVYACMCLCYFVCLCVFNVVLCVCVCVPMHIYTYLSHCFISMKRSYDQGNSYKRKHLIAGLLTVSEGYSIIIMVGAWWGHSGSM